MSNNYSYLILRTPSYYDNNSSFSLPHLLEHIAGEKELLSSKYFFDFHQSISRSYSGQCTEFRLDPTLDVDKIKTLLCSGYNGDAVEKERKILKDEIKESFDDFEYHAISQYGNHNSLQDVDSITDVQLSQYYKRYFQPENFIEFDYNYLPINTPHIDICNNEDISSLDSFTASIDGMDWRFLATHYRNYSEYLRLFFLSNLLDASLKYEHRFDYRETYDYPETKIFQALDKYILTYVDGYDFRITPEFFEQFRRYFISTLHLYDNASRAHHLVLFGTYPSNSSIRQVIEGFSYKQIIGLIQ